MRYALVISVLFLASCYKETHDVCPEGVLHRKLNTTYQAHFDTELTVYRNNYSDTTYIYRVYPEIEVLTTLDSGEKVVLNFAQYERYNVYVEEPDSMLTELKKLFDLHIEYSCPTAE